MTSERYLFASMIMRDLAIPDTLAHRGARRALVAWMHAETGEHPGLCTGKPKEGAAWNPLNTTLFLPGCTSYNTVPVRNYVSEAQGVTAVVQTLLHDTRYHPVVTALARPDVLGPTVLAAVAASPWGTPGWLLSAAWLAFLDNRSFYNHYPIGF